MTKFREMKELQQQVQKKMSQILTKHCTDIQKYHVKG